MMSDCSLGELIVGSEWGQVNAALAVTFRSYAELGMVPLDRTT